MLLKVTLQRAGGVDADDLLIDADPAATVASLAAAIVDRDPHHSGRVRTGDVSLRVEGPGTPHALDPSVSLADASLRSGDRIAVMADGGQFIDASDPRSAAAVMLVREGPDEGSRFQLRPGSNQVGRDRSNDLVLTDPMASKRHARFNVTEIVEVIDLGSVNGVFVSGEQVERAILRPGDQVLLGDTLLVVESIRSTGGTTSLGPSEPFNRSPYLDPVYQGEKLKAPEPPARPAKQRFPIIALIAPVMMGALMWAITGNPQSALFMLLSPVMIVGSHVQGRRAMKSDIAEATATYHVALDQLASTLERAQGEEVARRRLEHPPTAQLVGATTARAPMLWTRRPDRHSFLSLRLGLASLPTRTEVEMPQANNTLPELWDDLMQVVSRHARVEDVPLVADLPEVGVIGVAGSLDDALGSARSLVGQLAGLHSPAEVVLGAILSSDAAVHWDWLKWLPHTTSESSPVDCSLLAAGPHGAPALVAALRDLIDQRSPSGSTDLEAPVSPPLPAVVLVIDDAAPVERRRLVELAERGPAAGVFCIWVAPTIDALPAAAKAFLGHDPSTHQALAGFIDGGRSINPVSSEPLSGDSALSLARSMAPVTDAGARADELTDLPGRVSFVDQLGSDLMELPSAVLDRWRLGDSLPTPGVERRRRKKVSPLHALVGAGSDGPLQLDLRAHGPHALVGGTTGAGKSEFLQSWILGLAANHSPSRVTFLFVDYKGGAAFSECVKLPHTVGLVTDLTPHLVQRALESLNAELRHREHILNRKKVKDVLELERFHDPDTPPSLVIVVDEFAALVAEVPEFVDGVVNVAQRGRSLGLHLILATQRPAGVIKDNLRANTNLRVALRMADEDDSADVVGSKAAAAFDPAIPGRGIAKLGPGRLNPFQASYVGGWTTSEPPPPRIVISSMSAAGTVEWPEPDAVIVADVDPGPNDLHRLVHTITQAAADARIPLPRKPWLGELGATYDIARNPESETDVRLISRTDEILTFGVLDDPARQAQVPVAFEPDRDGNMAVIGTGGSGKSAFLRTLAVAGALSTRGGPCHVYGLDFASRGLDMLSDLPNVGAIITADDEERATRLLRTLRSTVDERLGRYAAVKADTISQYRQMAGQPDEARIVLLVDGYPAFRQEYETSGRQRIYDQFQSIATDGRQAGVHVVIAADRAGAIPSAMSSVIQKRLVLRLAGENEYAMAGAPADVFPTGTPPGRGWFNDREIQVAVLAGTPNTAEQAGAIGRLAAAARSRGVIEAPEVGALPVSVGLSSLPTTIGSLPVIGISDETLGPFGASFDDPIVVVGPPKSGKTTALTTLVAAARRLDPDIALIYVGEGRSSLLEAFQWDASVLPGPDTREQIDKLVAGWTGRRPSSAGSAALGVLVIDDVVKVASWGEADQIGQLITAVHSAGGAVLADGETSAMTGTYGIHQILKASRTGIVLVPDQYDGESVFKTPLPKLSRADFPPGRGFFVTGGRAQKLQVADTLAPAKSPGQDGESSP